jgi:FdhD protein
MTLPSFWRSALDPERVMRLEVLHWQEQAHLLREEQVTVEEPFEIRIDHQSLAVIMRTPGHDNELALGFLFSEGVIHHSDDVIDLAIETDEDGLPLANVVNVTLRSFACNSPSQAETRTFVRRFSVSSSCGLCGKNSIEDLFQVTEPLERDNLRFPSSMLYHLSEQLRSQQTVFGYTGGLHAAGLFTPSGELVLLREDVGRHNAVDKLVGYGLLHNSGDLYGDLYKESLLLVSGRTSFEIIQKALLARIPCVAAISAPSSLAVELANQAGITLIGFLRNQSMNVYTHPERIVAS